TDGDSLWFVGARGLMRLDLDTPAAPELVLADIARSHIGKDGSHWLIDDDGRLLSYADGRTTVQHRFSGSVPIADLATASDGTVWVVRGDLMTGITPAGNSDEHSRSHVREVGLPSVSDRLFIDREDIVWLAGQGGLIRFLGERFDHYSLRLGDVPQVVWSVSRDRSGNRYFGTADTLLKLSADDRLSDFGTALGLPDGAVRGLHYDGRYLWIGVTGQGLFRADPARRHAAVVAGTDGMTPLDIEPGRGSRLWIATYESGVLLLDRAGGEFTRFQSDPDANIYSLSADPAGGVWYTVDYVGLVRIAPDGLGGYTETVFGADSGFDSVSYNEVHRAASGDVWVGGSDGRLFRFRNGRATRMLRESPFADQSIYVLEPLSDERLIVGAEMGLYDIDLTTEAVTHYGARDGFLGIEANAHATHYESADEFWFGTMDGAARMDLALPPAKRPDLTPKITALRVRGSSRLIAASDALDWSERDLLAEFAAVSLRSPKDIEYSYRLHGLAEGWSEPTHNRSVAYSGLPPGRYRFAVRARLPMQDWSTPVTTGEFEILAPIWLRPWFLALAIALLFAAILAGVRYRTRSIERSNRRLREEVEARTRSIEEVARRLEASNRELSREAEQRRKADARRADLEARFQLAFLRTPIGMAVIDSQGRILDANPAMREMLNYPDEMTPPIASLPALIADAERDEIVSRLAELDTGSSDEIALSTACIAADGRSLDTDITITAIHNEEGSLLYSVAHVHDVTEAKRLTDRLEKQANHDDLTGLLNRRAFEAELARVYEEDNGDGVPSYLLYADLDQFKVVNDTSGHNAGDELLKRIGRVLTECVRGDDIVSRTGGDEFAFILKDCPEIATARVAEALRSAVEDFRFNWGDECYRVGISIGAVPINPELGSVEDIQQMADAACYQAKESGRNRVHIVTGGERDLFSNRGEARWAQRLRDAMDQRRFALYGQIIRYVGEREIYTGPEHVEVLLRMRDTDNRRLIPPGAFLPAAERYGLSTRLDQWLVQSLLDMLFVHTSMGAQQRCYWVNLSGASVGDRRFADFLIDAMESSPLPRGMINFEITETAVIRNITEAERLIQRLRRMGCQFALDDFGSGLSSFAYLKKLPIDRLKIDGMFVRDIVSDETDRLFVKSIIEIAHSMGMETTAEFVEDDAILEAVQALGVDFVQGFGVHRPELLAPQFPGTEIIAIQSNADAEDEDGGIVGNAGGQS
ncbi:MAG: EAL domain-containing protein, partial [Pseudomonadota bacterium]